MAKPPAEEPGKIPNSKRGDFHKHLAIYILIQEQMEVLKARAKANLKAAENAGLNPKKIKTTFDLSKKAPSEIAKHYAEEFEMLEFQGIEVAAQFNLFGGTDISSPKKGPDYYHAGLTAALHGKDGHAPKNLKGPDQQRWLEGWNDGVKARVVGGEFLAAMQAQLDAANNDGKKPEGSEDQVDLEDAIEQGKIIRIALSEFGPTAVLDEIDLEVCDLEADKVEKAELIEVFDENGRRNVLKARDGKTGVFEAEEQFEASADELSKQAGRPSTQPEEEQQ